MDERIILPKTAGEQLAQLPPRFELENMTEQLHEQVSKLLTESNVKVFGSSYRTKSLERILEKLKRRGWEYPVLDIHGLRFCMDQLSINHSANLIKANWKTPDMFPWGIPSLRIYSEARGFNPNSHPDYEAVHLNIVIPVGAKIAEIQLLTPEQMFLADKTRPYYQNKRIRFTLNCLT